MFPWHDGGIDGLARAAHKVDVAALLAGFNETNRLKPSLDLANKDGA